MKGFCYLALILAFIMFYNKDPIIALTILGILVGIFLLTKLAKSKKRNSSSLGLFSFRSGGNSEDPSLHTYLTFLMLKQGFGPLNTMKSYNTKEDVKKNGKMDQIEQEEKRILRLLESEEE